MQNFKSVYFADHPGGDAKRRNVKLAFGPGDVDLFQVIRPLASEEIRRLLGCRTFRDLKARATAEGRSLNAYSLGRLRKAVTALNSTQLDLFTHERLEDLPSSVTGSGEKIHEKVCRSVDHVPIRKVWRAGTMTAAVRWDLDPSGTPGTCASNTSNEKTPR